MRALTGAIITAAALVGLGLTAIGFGIRYQRHISEPLNTSTDQLYGAPSMTLILVVLLILAAVGLGITFLGLAFHHERRYRELHGHSDAMARREMVP
jgi:nitrate reductase gamma subunit